MTTLELSLPDDLTLEEWTHTGQKLTSDSNRSNWFIGDWANFGEKKYGKLKEFADANPLIPYQTIRNIASVCSRVKLSQRRDSLAWSYHEAVAKLRPREQDVWLDRARDESLTVGKLRAALRTADGEASALKSEGKSIELPTQHYDRLFDALKKKPAEFWTDSVKETWSDRFNALIRLIPS